MEALRGDDRIFDIFTRKEEYRKGLRDGLGRFPYYACEQNDVREPVVSKYLNEKGLRVEYPDGHRFAVCLSHDVDNLCPNNYFRKELDSIRSFMAGDFRGVIQRLQAPRIVRPYLDTREIIELEEKYGARSTFFFIASERQGPDFSYEIMDVKDDLRYLDSRGWEAGLHGTQAAHEDVERIKKEKERLESALGSKVVGYRNHFLRFQIPLTWRLLQQSGFKYDATLGFADCVGFRGGMCHPFRPYDLETNSIIDITEIPLVIMDATLFQNYMRLDINGAWELIKELVDAVEAQKGTMGLLWHNIYMHGEQLKLYERILQYCQEKGAWMPTGKELVEGISMEMKEQ